MTEKDVVIDNYFAAGNTFYDKNSNMNVVKIISGNYYVSNQPNDVLVTILGSCISACIRDPKAKIGGMNHFLLPGDNTNDSARFGAYAMEILINEIMKKGGRKERLEVKLFGGANIIQSNLSKIGDKNVEFIREYIEKEKLNVLTEDLGGTSPRRIHYYPHTGKVMMKKVQEEEDKKVIAEERNYVTKLTKETKSDGDIELF